MEISDCEGQRFDPGVVEIRLKQRRCSVRSVAEIGCNVKPKIIKRANKVESTATQVHAIVEVRKLGVLIHVLEVTAHVKLGKPANRKRRPAIRRGDGRSPF